MSEESIINKLETIFCSVIRKNNISLNRNSDFDNVDGWDSITHIIIIVEIEKKFSKKFTAREIQSWQTIGDIVNSLE